MPLSVEKHRGDGEAQPGKVQPGEAQPGEAQPGEAQPGGEVSAAPSPPQPVFPRRRCALSSVFRIVERDVPLLLLTWLRTIARAHGY